ncbi:MAG: hypothetical protein EXR78_06765 [Deltaproteobacteria bacterium]|nr:hypothetical protein [Deltaproteobacteria bacterium]
MLTKVHPAIIILILTLISGFCDSLGFTHAARMWQGPSLVFSEAIRSAVGFATGIAIYWITVRHLREAGIVTAEIQTLLWFGSTILGVAVLSGRSFSWRPVDQAVAVMVLVGIGWLIFHTDG